MQGFNQGRYRPYDSDPSKQSFNSLSGKHPLGDRARKLDQGILIVRFENPFNIWCLSCNGHIAQGVRFNAEKKKVGMYLSTPIFSFRCKCHLCQHWFEIRTDPKNTQYVCESGARRKIEDWDPEEEGNGAFIADTEAGSDRAPYSLTNPSASKDPFTALESQRKSRSRREELDSRTLELQSLSTSRNADPYALNSRLRDISRKTRHESIRKEMRDSDLKGRIGWREDQKLLEEGGTARQESKDAWEEERDRIGMDLTKRSAVSTNSSAFKGKSKSTSAVATSTTSKGSGPSTGKKKSSTSSTLSSKASSLAARLLENTRRKKDPFGGFGRRPRG